MIKYFVALLSFIILLTSLPFSEVTAATRYKKIALKKPKKAKSSKFQTKRGGIISILNRSSQFSAPPRAGNVCNTTIRVSYPGLLVFTPSPSYNQACTETFRAYDQFQLCFNKGCEADIAYPISFGVSASPIGSNQFGNIYGTTCTDLVVCTRKDPPSRY